MTDQPSVTLKGADLETLGEESNPLTHSNLATLQENMHVQRRNREERERKAAAFLESQAEPLSSDPMAPSTGVVLNPGYATTSIAISLKRIADTLDAIDTRITELVDKNQK